MKPVLKFIVACVFLVMLVSTGTAVAQCAMCGTVAESSTKNGQTEGKDLNKGIVYLLAAPYLAIVGIGFLWYKKYRKKDVQLDMRDDKINMN